MNAQQKFIEALKAKAKAAREKAIAEGRTMSVREIRNPFLEKLKAKAKAEGKELKPMPLTIDKVNAMKERFTIKKK